MMIEKEELKEWDDKCKRQIRRSLQERMDYGFIYTYKPVLDDAPSRVFDSTKEYRQWCNQNLPSYLRYRSDE
ncbi:MAG: hypothetical protein AAB267_02990 [Candidatus Desantisbacteria bacterium]